MVILARATRYPGIVTGSVDEKTHLVGLWVPPGPYAGYRETTDTRPAAARGSCPGLLAPRTDPALTRLPAMSTRPVGVPVAPVWADDGPLDPGWPAPDAAPPRVVPAGLVAVAVLVVLALVAGLVWRLGGFERRTDVFVESPPGSTVTAGPYELRFTHATAQQRTDFRNEVTWRVIVIGEGRTTGTTTMAPSDFGSANMFAAKDRPGGETQVPQGQTFRAGSFTDGAAFTPGLPLQPFRVQFDFSSHYQPGATLIFVAFDQEFRDSSLLGNQEPSWVNADTAHLFHLPVQVLPPQLS